MIRIIENTYIINIKNKYIFDNINFILEKKLRNYEKKNKQTFNKITYFPQ